MKCISITNIMDFTGVTRDGVVVTDDSCFFRFFNGAEYHQIALGQDSEVIVAATGRLREKDEPTPDELMTFLASPQGNQHAPSIYEARILHCAPNQRANSVVLRLLMLNTTLLTTIMSPDFIELLSSGFALLAAFGHLCVDAFFGGSLAVCG